MTALDWISVALAVVFFVGLTVSKKKHPTSTPELNTNIPENRAQFSYRNSQGILEHRDVDIIRAWDAGGVWYFEGFCYLRGAERTFRADRIQGHAVLLATNTPLTGENLAKRFATDTSQAPEQGPRENKIYWPDTKLRLTPANLRIEYINEKGAPSARNIHVHAYNGTSWLDADCDLAGEALVFRIDRIKSCVDMDTGEMVTDLPAHLWDKYRTTPDYRLWGAMDKLTDILTVLFTVGKADGALRRPEREILHAIIRKVAKHPELTEKDFDKAIRTRLVVTNGAELQAAIDRIARDTPQQMPAVLALAKKMVGTDKTVKPAELEILAQIEQKIGELDYRNNSTTKTPD